jgi:Ca2+-binding RTX toxin-like protein
LGSGVNTFSNKGTVSGDVTADAGSTNTIVNSKTIGGDILLDDGNDKVTNSGTVATIDLGDGVNSLTNSGTIAALIGGAGIDTIHNSGIIQTVDLGGGDDKYTGGAKSDSVGDSDGSDTILLGSGNDMYDATGATSDGVDKIDGGAGIDLYGAMVATKVSINLDTVSHDGSAIHSLDPQYTVAKNTAEGAGIGTDTVLNFENVDTGTNDDLVHGNAAANLIQTGAGNDILIGYGGNDILFGGAGADLLSGGKGHDTLIGGVADNAVDTFIYTALSDSTVAKAGRDLIQDFEDGFDKIDLSGIDANAKLAGDQAFDFIGVNEHFLAAADVRVLTTATGYAIEADVTGDGKADFAIDVADLTHSITWTSSDFIL